MVLTAQARLSRRRLGALGASGFNPLTLSPAFWLKADTIVGADGSVVQAWPDLSGNGFTAVQATTGAQPALKKNIINGKAVVRFDGVDDYLAINNAMTIGAVAFVVASAVSGNWTQYGGILTPNDIAYSGWFVDDGTTYLDAPVNRWLNGVDVSANGANSYAPIQTFKVFYGTVAAGAYTSSTWNVGFDQEGAVFLGDFAEMIGFQTVLSTVQQSQLTNYLSARYGISTAPTPLYQPSLSNGGQGGGTLAAPKHGDVLTVSSNGKWGGALPQTFTYKWYNTNVGYLSVTTQSYTIQLSDVGYYVGCEVTATNSIGANYQDIPTLGVVS